MHSIILQHPFYAEIVVEMDTVIKSKYSTISFQSRKYGNFILTNDSDYVNTIRGAITFFYAYAQ